MDADDVIERVREHLTDTVETYRYSDAELTDAVTSAVAQLADDRPDVKLKNDGTLLSTVAVTDLDDGYKETLVNWICFRMLMKDGEDTHNMQLSQMHLAAYKDAIS